MTPRSVYSHYLPLKRNARTASRSASVNKDSARSPTKEKETRSGRTSSTSLASHKRRSTLNSREAGYDEAEALRRAIEASKVEVVVDPHENGSRRPKRGRSDSQEYDILLLWMMVDANTSSGSQKTPKDRGRILGRCHRRPTRTSRIQTTPEPRLAMEHRNRNRAVRLPAISEPRKRRTRRSESGSGSRRRTGEGAGPIAGELRVCHPRSLRGYLALTRTQIQILQKNCLWQLGRW